MRKSYVIQWKSSINGRTGRGTNLFSQEEAQRLAEELNQGYPWIQHEVIEVESSASAERPQAVSEDAQSTNSSEINPEPALEYR